MTNSSRKLKLVSNNCLDNVLKPRGKIHKQLDSLFSNIDKNYKYYRKITEKSGGDIPQKHLYNSATKSYREPKLVSNDCYGIVI